VVSSLIEKAKSPMYDEDSVLVERYLAGDHTVFEVLYNKYYDKVAAIARGIVLDNDEAADAVQEIFTLVYRHLARFDKRSKFSTWLFRVAVNRSIQQARRLKYKTRQVPLNEALGQSTPEEVNDAEVRVQEALAKLSPQDRALLTLFYWEEHSLQEIAEALHCGLNAAKTRLYRARERFRGVYEGGVT
jgi:RNA polymerase sigma-70 factor (ECF subfamily)